MVGPLQNATLPFPILRGSRNYGWANWSTGLKPKRDSNRKVEQFNWSRSTRTNLESNGGRELPNFVGVSLILSGICQTNRLLPLVDWYFLICVRHRCQAVGFVWTDSGFKLLSILLTVHVLIRLSMIILKMFLLVGHFHMSISQNLFHYKINMLTLLQGLHCVWAQYVGMSMD